MPVSAARASALGDLAASMQPGQWAQLKTNGTSVMLKANGGNLLEYSNRGAWDPAGKRVYFCGASHHGSFYNDCVRYDEATNTWSSIGVPPGYCRDNCAPDFSNGALIVHGYDQNAFDTNRRVFYFRQDKWLRKYDTMTSTWSSTPEMPRGQGCLAVNGTLEYFPDIDRMVYLNARCKGDAFYYNPATDAWSVPQSPINALGNGEIHTLGTYSKEGFIYGGCGNDSSEQWRVNKNLVWERMGDTPTGCAIPYTLLVADPASGRPLHFAKSIYELNPKTNTWTDTGVAAKCPADGSCSAFVVPISNHGVIMFVRAFGVSSVEVWVYKHAASALTNSDTTAPSIPTTLTAVPASSSQMNLSWTASTDNIGVTGYLLERCQGTACTNFTQIAAPTAVSYSDTGLTTDTAYSYRVRAQDAASNISSYSTISSATPRSSTGGSDFQTRCRQPGVIKCVGFDSSADLAGKYGSPSGILPGPGNSATIDTVIKASGGGALRFFVPAGQPGAYSGSYFTNFSDDFLTQFGENSEFYIQFRVRMTPEYINAGNFKVTIIGTGDKPGCIPSATATGNCYASCTAPDVVVQTSYNWYRYPTMYNSCTGSASHGPYDSFQQSFGSDYKNQNARPNPFCLYTQTVAQRQFPPTGNCFGYFPNEWMTFQIHMKIGPRVGNEFTNSFVDLWMSREGRPSEPVIAWGPYNLSAGTPSDNEKYGKIWFLPYTGSEVFPSDAYVWYDELIISRSKIPDPGSSQSGQAPAAPSGLSLR